MTKESKRDESKRDESKRDESKRDETFPRRRELRKDFKGTFYDAAFTGGVLNTEKSSNEINGKTLFSLLLPKDFYYKNKDVVIRDGILSKGVLTKTQIGIESNSIVQFLTRKIGGPATSEFLSSAQFISNRYLFERGFSVGWDDVTQLSDSSRQEITQKLREIQQEVMDILNPEDLQTTDVLKKLEIERRIIELLNNALETGNVAVKSGVPEENAFRVMITSKAKGKDFNMTQIMSFLGQQNLEGQRMPLTLSTGRRTLPYFEEDDPDPAARGWISNNFTHGLNPYEYWFHMASVRDGLIDVSIKTGDAGYQSRKFVKAAEDLRIFYDNTLRMPNSGILSFSYGGDNIHPAECFRNDDWTTFINADALIDEVNEKFEEKKS